ncbi:hypothetical protein VU04_12195, partial [Desulfobulbus sp. TB]|nr:hypothetical protein [Desulfobulbus sp. TB]
NVDIPQKTLGSQKRPACFLHAVYFPYYSKIIRRIIERSCKELWIAFSIFVSVSIILAIQRNKISKESIPALIIGTGYFIGITVIYLLTPLDLMWHLNTSIDRTMLAVQGSIFVAIYYMLPGSEEVQTV